MRNKLFQKKKNKQLKVLFEEKIGYYILVKKATINDEKSLFIWRIEYHMGIRTFNQLNVLNKLVPAY